MVWGGRREEGSGWGTHVLKVLNLRIKKKCHYCFGKVETNLLTGKRQQCKNVCMNIGRTGM